MMNNVAMDIGRFRFSRHDLQKSLGEKNYLYEYFWSY
jgi:hypothetical protein